MTAPQSYPVYKGLGAPLVFRQLKGSYIYYGLGCLLTGLLLTMLLSALVSLLIGILTGFLISGLGFWITLLQQGKGLYHKSRAIGIIHFSRIL